MEVCRGNGNVHWINHMMMMMMMTGASIPMGQGEHVPQIFMKRGRPW